jgi:hypothetical protein
MVCHVGTLQTILTQLQRKINVIAKTIGQVKKDLVGMMQVDIDDNMKMAWKMWRCKWN